MLWGFSTSGKLQQTFLWVRNVSNPQMGTVYVMSRPSAAYVHCVISVSSTPRHQNYL